MRKLTTIALALLVTTGCIIHTSDRDDEFEVDVPVVDTNYAPIVTFADAGCYWDSYYHDDIWYFEADVDDYDGPLDVVQVWADVYDEWDGSFVESFELFPTDDPYLWYSDWLGSSTWLDCWYDNYSVDIVAYDTWNDYDYMTIWANTY